MRRLERVCSKENSHDLKGMTSSLVIIWKRKEDETQLLLFTSVMTSMIVMMTSYDLEFGRRSVAKVRWRHPFWESVRVRIQHRTALSQLREESGNPFVRYDVIMSHLIYFLFPLASPLFSFPSSLFSFSFASLLFSSPLNTFAPFCSFEKDDLLGFRIVGGKHYRSQTTSTTTKVQVHRKKLKEDKEKKKE